MIEQLTPEHQRFVYAYCANLNKTQAYLTAFPSSSIQAARDSAYRLYQKPEIKEAVEEILNTQLETQKVVLRRLVSLIEFDLTDYLTEANQIDVKKLNADGLGWLVKGLRQTRYGTEIYLIDKDRILEMLAKAHKLFESTQIEVNFTERLNAENLLNDQIESIRVKFEGNDSPN